MARSQDFLFNVFTSKRRIAQASRDDRSNCDVVRAAIMHRSQPRTSRFLETRYKLLFNSCVTKSAVGGCCFFFPSQLISPVLIVVPRSTDNDFAALDLFYFDTWVPAFQTCPPGSRLLIRDLQRLRFTVNVCTVGQFQFFIQLPSPIVFGEIEVNLQQEGMGFRWSCSLVFFFFFFFAIRTCRLIRLSSPPSHRVLTLLLTVNRCRYLRNPSFHR